MLAKSCPLCEPAAERLITRGTLAFALWDGYPVSPGHALVAPVRHVGSWFDLTADEHAAMLLFLDEVRTNVEGGFQPDGFNIGINDGRGRRTDDSPRAHPPHPALRRRRARPARRRPLGACRQGRLLVGRALTSGWRRRTPRAVTVLRGTAAVASPCVACDSGRDLTPPAAREYRRTTPPPLAPVRRRTSAREARAAGRPLRRSP